MTKKDTLLNLSIQREIARTDFIFNDTDNEVAQEMIQEINTLGYNFHYFAEIESYKIPGSGRIVLKYVNRFKEEATRAYLVAQMVSDGIQDCGKVILQLYLHFKLSSAYISGPGVPSPAHIYVRYDNAFNTLKPKKLKNELLKLAFNPRDAFYLPFTMRMLASWKLPEMKNLLISYAMSDSITAHDVGICDDGKVYFPPLEFIKRELKFTAIAGLKNYPSEETINVIAPLAASADNDIKTAAKRTLKALVQ